MGCPLHVPASSTIIDRKKTGAQKMTWEKTRARASWFRTSLLAYPLWLLSEGRLELLSFWTNWRKAIEVKTNETERLFTKKPWPQTSEIDEIQSRTSSGGWTQIRLDWSTSRHHKASKKDEGWYKELNTFPRSLPIGSSQSCPTADVSSKRHLLREGELGTTFCLPSQKARLHLRRWAISQGRKPLIRNCTSLVIKGIPQKEEWVRWGR